MMHMFCVFKRSHFFLSIIKALILFTPLAVSAAEYKATLIGTGELTAPAIRINSGLQQKGGGDGARFSVNSLFGSVHGVLLGLGYGILEKEYIYNNEANLYQMELRYGFLNVGYWKQLSGKNHFLLYGSLGYGQLQLKKDGIGEFKKNDAKILSAHMDYYHRLMDMLDLIVGVGISKMIVSDFTYNETEFQSSKFGTPPIFIIRI